MSNILIQGNLDNGCGFYSVLNAISEVNNMDFERSVALFRALSKKNPEIVSHGQLKGLCFTHMQNTVIPSILDLLLPEDKVNCRFPFSDMKFESVSAFASRLKTEIETRNGVATIGFGQPWGHWTAVTRVTEHAIILKDSTHHKRKMIDSLALASNDGAYTEGTIIHPRQTALFSR